MLVPLIEDDSNNDNGDAGSDLDDADTISKEGHVNSDSQTYT